MTSLQPLPRPLSLRGFSKACYTQTKVVWDCLSLLVIFAHQIESIWNLRTSCMPVYRKVCSIELI